MTKQKQEGQYMTPKPIVDMVLDGVGYSGSSILDKKICEPSFGTGAFLIRIASRIIAEGREAGLDNTELAVALANNIYGFEKDKELYRKGIERLNLCLKVYGIESASWDNLVCGDTLLLYKELAGTMDYVVGNPPFVIVHNIPVEYREVVKDFHFADGILNIYISFFELGYAMLNETGKLAFISPNSFLKNKSQQAFRSFLRGNRCLSSLWDFKESKLFPTADAYSCITILDKAEHTDMTYREYDMLDMKTEFQLPLSDLSEKPWSFCDKQDADFLKANKAMPVKLSSIAHAWNGIATLRDGLFVHDMFCDKQLCKPYYGKFDARSATVYFKENDSVVEVEKCILRKSIKASSYDGSLSNSFIIFPYCTDSGKTTAIREDYFKCKAPNAYCYLLSHKGDLMQRDADKSAEWFTYGRKQGLEQFKGTSKLVVKHIFPKNATELAFSIVPSEVAVYSGIYVMVEDAKLDRVCEVLSSKEFLRYCKLVGKDMSGGYLSIASKDIQNFGIV